MTNTVFFLRQLCCHPKLADEIKDMLESCKTLEDIERMMVSHYEKQMIQAQKPVDYYKKRIETTQKKIKMIDRKRQCRALRKKGYTVQLFRDDIKIEENNINVDIEEPNVVIANDDDDEEDLFDDEQKPGKLHMIVNEANSEAILELVGKELNKYPSKTIENLNDYIKEVNGRLKTAITTFDGKRTTYEFYKNVFDRIKKTAQKNSEDDKNEEDDDDDEDDEDENVCGICLGEIPESNIGVTKCGHIFVTSVSKCGHRKHTSVLIATKQ